MSKDAKPTDQEYERRRKVGFLEAEGLAQPPRQLKLGEISQELRAVTWAIVYKTMEEERYSTSIAEPWFTILSSAHILRDHKPIDEFDARYRAQSYHVKMTLMHAPYGSFFDFLTFILRHSNHPKSLPADIAAALELTRSAYRLVGGDTFVPIATDQDTATFERAIRDATQEGFVGARAHLKSAAEHCTAGRFADSVRESIHAVESVAVIISPGSRELGPALAKLSKGNAIHGGLKDGFRSIYGYTSDEKGVRHSLTDGDSARVDEIDALFMLGACASFVSYLIGKAKLTASINVAT